MTCHLRTYSFLKIQSKVPAHTLHLQKRHIYLKVINRKQQACRQYGTVYTYTIYTWNLKEVTMQAAPAACFYTQISVIQVSHMKHRTQELIPSKGSPKAKPGSHTGQLGCPVTFLPFLEPPDLDSFPSECCLAE